MSGSSMFVRLISTLLMLGSVFFQACQSPITAQEIVDQAIEHHGGELYEHAYIEFDFRNKHYVLKLNGGKFTYERIFTDSTGHVRDVLDNSGFRRYINDTLISLNETWAKRYTRSVNSVAYFALLPHGLNDPAVVKTLAGEGHINGTKYYRIHVSFLQEGGGEDYEDEFMYWFDKTTFRMDYLAYFYHTDGGGTRFRVARNVRRINGILMADYLNLGIEKVIQDLTQTEVMYTEQQLDTISSIELEHVHVDIL